MCKDGGFVYATGGNPESRHVTVLSRVLFGGVDEGLLCDAWAKIYANIQ